MNGNSKVADLLRAAADLMGKNNTRCVTMTADIDGISVLFELRLVGELRQPKTKEAKNGKPASTH